MKKLIYKIYMHTHIHIMFIHIHARTRTQHNIYNTYIIPPHNHISFLLKIYYNTY